MTTYINFKKNRLRNLSNYSIENLKVGPGTYNYRDKSIALKHILPDGNKELNLLYPYNTKEYLDQLNNEYKLHKYYYHLNSSQILAFNYFLPFLTNDFGIGISELSKIFSIILKRDLFIDKLELEKESSLEEKYLKNSKDKMLRGNTTFDVFLSGKNENISIEIKYTEYGLGIAKNDLKHREKFKQCYKKCIIENNLHRYLDAKHLELDFFLKNYQLMRNLLHIFEYNQTVVFLFPKENIKVYNELKAIQETIKDPLIQSKIILLSWEDLVRETLIMFKEKPVLTKYYSELYDKYFR